MNFRLLCFTTCLVTIFFLGGCQQQDNTVATQSKQSEVAQNDISKHSDSTKNISEHADDGENTAKQSVCNLPPIRSAEDVGRFSKACKAKTECKLIAAERCYCPPGVQCICGGGKGPRCVDKNEKTDGSKVASNLTS